MNSSLTSLAFERTSFRILDCAACQTQALVYVDVDEAGVDVPRCLNCNALAPVDQPRVRAAGSRAVESLGYRFLHKARRDPRAQKLSGCGAKGIKSCGSGGCSSGSCGTGGGGCGGGCGSK